MTVTSMHSPPIVGPYTLGKAIRRAWGGVMVEAVSQGRPDPLHVILLDPAQIDPEAADAAFAVATMVDHPVLRRPVAHGIHDGRATVALLPSTSVPLTALTASLHRGGQVAPLGLLSSLGAELAEALQLLDDRDLKLLYGRLAPSQIRIRADGQVQLCEVALSPAAATAMRFDDLDAFAAPEVRQGERPTLASDVYSLARVLSWLWCGDPDADAAMALAREQEPVLASLLHGALHEDPDKRVGLSMMGAQLDELEPTVIIRHGDLAHASSIDWRSLAEFTGDAPFRDPRESDIAAKELDRMFGRGDVSSIGGGSPERMIVALFVVALVFSLGLAAGVYATTEGGVGADPPVPEPPHLPVPSPSEGAADPVGMPPPIAPPTDPSPAPAAAPADPPVDAPPAVEAAAVPADPAVEEPVAPADPPTDDPEEPAAPADPPADAPDPPADAPDPPVEEPAPADEEPVAPPDPPADDAEAAIDPPAEAVEAPAEAVPPEVTDGP